MCLKIFPMGKPGLSSELTEQERNYCALIVEGVTKRNSYLQAFPACTTLKSASVLATRLGKRLEIVAEIKRLRDATETPKTLSRQEKREFLARNVRANREKIVGDLESGLGHVDADLVSEITPRYDKEGDRVGTSYKFESKNKSIEIDNLMAGHNEPIETNVNVTSGVLMIPTGGKTLDEWEKTTVSQQEELLKAGDKDKK